MPDKTVVGLGAILLKSWLPPRLVPGIAYAILAISSILFLVFVGHLYVVAFAVVGILAAILIFWCRSVLQYNQLRQAAVRGDATRTHIVEQSATSPDEGSIEIQLKYPMKHIWFSIGWGLPVLLLLGFDVYLSEKIESPSGPKEFPLAMFVFLALVMLHHTLYLVNRSRFTIIANQDGITTRNWWSSRRIRWHDIGLFWIQPTYAIRNFELVGLLPAFLSHRYEIATNKVSLTIPFLQDGWSYSKERIDDSTTYDARMHALVAMIERRSGVPLRALNAGKGSRSPT